MSQLGCMWVLNLFKRHLKIVWFNVQSPLSNPCLVYLSAWSISDFTNSVSTTILCFKIQVQKSLIMLLRWGNLPPLLGSKKPLNRPHLGELVFQVLQGFLLRLLLINSFEFMCKEL